MWVSRKTPTRGCGGGNINTVDRSNDKGNGSGSPLRGRGCTIPPLDFTSDNNFNG